MKIVNRDRFVARRGRTITVGLCGKQATFEFTSPYQAAHFRNVVGICNTIAEVRELARKVGRM